jgi:hypothetical protein
LLKISKRERALLFVLMWALAVSAAGIVCYFKVEEMSALQQKTALLEKQVQKSTLKAPNSDDLLKKKELLMQRIGTEKEKYYYADEIDPYKFSTVIKNILSEKGLYIKKYQTIEVKERTYLEYSVSGDALQLAAFLRVVAGSEKYWSIPFLSIDARKGDGTVDAVFRINYETIDEKNY